MMSFSCISRPSRSSERRIGRPTIEGYWWSGKFCGVGTMVSRLRGRAAELADGANGPVRQSQPSGNQFRRPGLELGSRQRGYVRSSGELAYQSEPPPYWAVERLEASGGESLEIANGGGLGGGRWRDECLAGPGGLTLSGVVRGWADFGLSFIRGKRRV